MSDIKNKQQFSVKLECLIPATITYRVIASDEQEALKEIDKYSTKVVAFQENKNKKIKIKATVYKLNTSMVKLSKTYRSI